MIFYGLIGDVVIVRNGDTDSDFFVDDDWIFNAACKKILLL